MDPDEERRSHDEVGEDEDTWLRHWDPGRWLALSTTQTAQADCAWLETLAEFDRDATWATYGQLTCAEWLMLHTGMARATAYEKLRVAHQLSTRPALADAYRSGQLSYSALRACCRVDDPDSGVDEAFVAVACAGTVTDVERAVRTYLLHHQQETPPPPVAAQRRLRVIPWTEGVTKIELLVSDIEAAELTATLNAFIDTTPLDHCATDPGDGSATADRSGDTEPDDADRDSGDAPTSGSGDESAAADRSSQTDSDGPATAPGDASAPADRRAWPTTRSARSWGERRADAFCDMVRAARETATGDPGGADRFLIHLVSRDGGDLTFIDGTPVHPAHAASVRCDASIVAHHVSDSGEPLHLGRRTREWSTAQRRAARVRDGGTCRFPGCPRRTTDLHHQLPWEAGGSTDVTNAISLCPRHHTLIHEGFRVHGDPGGTLRFTDPDGWPAGTTTPVQARLLDLDRSTDERGDAA